MRNILLIYGRIFREAYEEYTADLRKDIRYFLLDVFLDSGGWFFQRIDVFRVVGSGFSGRCVPGVIGCYYGGP